VSSNASFINKKTISESESPSGKETTADVTNQIADAANSFDSNIDNTNTSSNKLETLQVDTDHRPSSRSSNSSGVHMPPMGLPGMPFSYIRPPMPGGFRYPYPNPQMAAFMQQQQQQQLMNHESAGSSDQNMQFRQSPMGYQNFQSPAMMYRMHPMMAQQQFMQQMNSSLTMPPKSNASSQQPSPSGSVSNQSYNNINNTSLPYSATFPGGASGPSNLNSKLF